MQEQGSDCEFSHPVLHRHQVSSATSRPFLSSVQFSPSSPLLEHPPIGTASLTEAGSELPPPLLPAPVPLPFGNSLKKQCGSSEKSSHNPLLPFHHHSQLRAFGGICRMMSATLASLRLSLFCCHLDSVDTSCLLKLPDHPMFLFCLFVCLFYIVHGFVPSLRFWYSLDRRRVDG